MWIRNVKIKKVSEGGFRKQEDRLVLETTVTLQFNDEPPITFIGTRQHQKALCLGYLFAEGKVSRFSDVTFYEEEGGVVTIKGRASSETLIPEPSYGMNILDVFELSGSVQEQSYLYKDTAVTHSASLSTKGDIHHIAEDLLGIQAVYKVLGLAFEAELSPTELTLFTTDKIDESVVRVALKVGLPILASRTGVTDKAFDAAEDEDLTIIGFARGRRFNVYTDCKQRLNLSAI